MSRWPAGCAAAALALALPLVAGCGDDAVGSDDDGLTVEAAFYPLQWMAEQVGGAHVRVESLTPPGAEPHDLELTPADVASISEADLVVYLRGFQPAVDDAVEQAAADAVFDAAPAADLDLAFAPIDDGEQHDDEDGTVDPHFWLDPTRLAAVADAFADQLATLDPSHADDYAANLASLTDELGVLDDAFTTGLADCANTNLVTSHSSFGYLARRYHLTQAGITGLSPEEEPSPADLAEVTRFVEDHDVSTVYVETLVSPDIAETVAAETGATVDVLDPIEGLTDQSQGRDYLEVMDANLANLRRGQSCR